MKTIAFMKFRNNLHVWSQHEGFKDLGECSHIKSFDDSKLFLLSKPANNIRRLKVSFSNYKIEEIYKETHPGTQIL